MRHQLRESPSEFAGAPSEPDGTWVKDQPTREAIFRIAGAGTPQSLSLAFDAELSSTVSAPF